MGYSAPVHILVSPAALWRGASGWRCISSGEIPLTVLDSFGIRSVPPCGDCHDDGTCAMNCGPAIKSESLPWQTAKARSEIVCPTNSNPQR